MYVGLFSEESILDDNESIEFVGSAGLQEDGRGRVCVELSADFGK